MATFPELSIQCISVMTIETVLERNLMGHLIYHLL